MAKIFDWDKAAKIIKEHNIKNASAGLEGDWSWTGGIILDGGEIVPREETYTFLASDWAIPILRIDDDDDGYDDDVIDCWIDQEKTAWDADTYWPESAKKILKGE